MSSKKFDAKEIENSKRIFKSATPKYTIDWYIKWVASFILLSAMAMRANPDFALYDQVLSLTGTFGSLAGNAARVTVVHNLGAAKDLDGNTIANPVNFSLPRDIDHLNVYRGTTSNFTISSNNQVGQIIATVALSTVKQCSKAE